MKTMTIATLLTLATLSSIASISSDAGAASTRALHAINCRRVSGGQGISPTLPNGQLIADVTSTVSVLCPVDSDVSIGYKEAPNGQISVTAHGYSNGGGTWSGKLCVTWKAGGGAGGGCGSSASATAGSGVKHVTLNMDGWVGAADGYPFAYMTLGPKVGASVNVLFGHSFSTVVF
jgi:hypothetical protein